MTLILSISFALRVSTGALYSPQTSDDQIKHANQIAGHLSMIKLVIPNLNLLTCINN